MAHPKEGKAIQSMFDRYFRIQKLYIKLVRNLRPLWALQIWKQYFYEFPIVRNYVSKRISMWIDRLIKQFGLWFNISVGYWIINMIRRDTKGATGEPAQQKPQSLHNGHWNDSFWHPLLIIIIYGWRLVSVANAFKLNKKYS